MLGKTCMVSLVWKCLTCVDVKREHLVEKTEKLLKSRAETGDTQASYLLGHLYYERVIIPMLHVCETQ